MRGNMGRKGQGVGQSLLTILFTDIEDSTALTQRLGDARAQAEVVRIHNGFVRNALASRGGSEIKHTGDGIMATFPSATATVSCAIAIREASAQHNRDYPDAAFSVRIGLNAGEPVAEDDDVYGTAVQLAARICAQAAPGQILASDVVRQLVAGKGLLFDALGAVQLKGFDAAVPVFEIRAEAEAGEQLWRDTQTQQPEKATARRLLRPPVVAGAALLGIGGVAALAAALVLLGGDGESAGAPEYRQINVRNETTGVMDVIPGDCVTTDIVFRGTGESALTGHQSGTLFSTFEARVRAASECSSLALAYDATYRFAGADSLLVRSAGYSSQPLLGVDLENLAGGASVNDRGVIYGGTGVYAGIAGTASCRSVGLRVGTAAGGQVGFESSGNCTFSIAPAADLDPITLTNAADASSLTTQGGASGASDQLTLTAVYHNNRDFPLTGLALRLPAPEGVRLAPVSAGASTTDETISWSLPDLPADGVATFEFSIRLLSADADEIAITPEMLGDQLDGPIRGDAISLTVTR